MDIVAPILARAKAQSAEAFRVVCGTATNAEEETVRNSRNDLGRMVREVWLEWAREQPNPKPSWLLSWDELSEPDREVDRRIGETLASHGWKDAERRIAELEQANRDLERLRVEASRERDEARERATMAEQQEREAKEAEERAWTAMRVAREQANGLCQEAENLRVRLRIADRARITFRDKLYGEKSDG